MMRRDPSEVVADLREVERQLNEAWKDISTWQVHIGPVKVNKVMTSRSWFLVLVSVCVFAFAAGVALTLIKETKELGIALVVGSIFAAASFLGQVWTVQVQKEHQVSGDLWGAEQRRHLQRLIEAREKLVDERDAASGGAVRG
ncbi:hypothetical protein [Actinoplanes cyaneus]|uniref:hypothetical protein n=1 Tax=Actinoplanes cyaneus TaxID=52696 RepID=UPI00194313E2|nr:hypothetical protein [Actinoplanes cyaneus]